MSHTKIPADIIKSAQLTADAWGTAYVYLTMSCEHIAGGTWHVRHGIGGLGRPARVAAVLTAYGKPDVRQGFVL